MTPQELEKLRVSARFAALEGIVAGLIKQGKLSRGARQQAAQDIDHWVAAIEKTAFPGYPPEYADLLAAELHAAAESLGSFLKAHVLKE